MKQFYDNSYNFIHVKHPLVYINMKFTNRIALPGHKKKM